MVARGWVLQHATAEPATLMPPVLRAMQPRTLQAAGEQSKTVLTLPQTTKRTSIDEQREVAPLPAWDEGALLVVDAHQRAVHAQQVAHLRTSGKYKCKRSVLAGTGGFTRQAAKAKA